MAQIIHQHKQKKLAPSPDQNKHFKMLLPRWHHLSSVPGLKERLGGELDKHCTSAGHSGFKRKVWLRVYTERSEAFVVSCFILVSVLWFLGSSAQSYNCGVIHCVPSSCFSWENKNSTISNCWQILRSTLSTSQLLSVCLYLSLQDGLSLKGWIQGTS